MLIDSFPLLLSYQCLSWRAGTTARGSYPHQAMNPEKNDSLQYFNLLTKCHKLVTDTNELNE